MVGNSSIPTKPFVINRENLVLSSKELEISEATGRGAGEQMPLLRETRSRGPGCVSLCPRPSLLPRAAASIKGGVSLVSCTSKWRVFFFSDFEKQAGSTSTGREPRRARAERPAWLRGLAMRPHRPFYKRGFYFVLENREFLFGFQHT